MWHYARGLAFAARHDVGAARDELASVRTIAGEVKDDVIIILNTAPSLLKLAAEVLAGDIAAEEKRVRRGDRALATGGGPRGRAHLRRAAAVVPLGA